MADIAYEYFTNDSDYQVVAFTVHSSYFKEEEKFGLPVYRFERINEYVEPDETSIFIAIGYHDMNRLRVKILSEAKKMGFTPASYVSSRAFVSKSAKIGEHCFVFEDNTIQPFVIIGENNILWSGNHIGHHSKIGSDNFISSHVVISGWVEIGNNCFFGVNSTIANGVKISDFNWLNPGSTLTKDLGSLNFILGAESKATPLDIERLNRKLQNTSEKRPSFDS